MSALPTTDLDVLLTDEQIAEFHEQGFTHVERLTTDEELEWLREQFDAVFDPRNENQLVGGYFDASRPMGSTAEQLGPPVLPQAIRPELVITELTKTIVYRNAGADRRAAARPRRRRARAVDAHDRQAARTGHDTPWHQDEAFWELDLGYHACAVWLALDDVDVDNGCMQFLPGSHQRGIVTHRHLYDDPMVERAGDRRRRRLAGRARAPPGGRGHVPHPDDHAPHRPEPHRPPPPGLRPRGPAPALEDPGAEGPPLEDELTHEPVDVSHVTTCRMSTGCGVGRRQ